MRKLWKSLAVTMAAAGLLVAASPAAAGPRVTMQVGDEAEFPGRDGMKCTDNSSGPGPVSAEVCYDPANDRFWVYDAKRDGNSAVALWKQNSTQTVTNSAYCRNREGVRSWAFCQLDFPGQGFVEFAAGIYDGNSGPKEKAFPDRFRGWTSSIF
jgi:hypothetical protein